LKKNSFRTYDRMVVRDVLTNQGGAYNNNTGIFTAPRAGTYVFAATTGPDKSDQWALMALMRNGKWVALTSAKDKVGGYSASSLHAVLRLARGHTVWLRATRSATYWSSVTMFSGFLLHPDP
jgi:hypothetical protein